MNSWSRAVMCAHDDFSGRSVQDFPKGVSILAI